MNKFKIGIFGSESSSHLTRKEFSWVELLGKQIAQKKHILFNGGGTGMMALARETVLLNRGQVVSIMPHLDETRKYAQNEIAIHTECTKVGRVPIFVQSIDAAIALGGGSGSLMEIIACYLSVKPIIIVDAFYKKYDPRINRILNRKKIICINDKKIVLGYLDTKDPQKVLPVFVCKPNLSPEIVVDILFNIPNCINSRKYIDMDLIVKIVSDSLGKY